MRRDGEHVAYPVWRRGGGARLHRGRWKWALIGPRREPVGRSGPPTRRAVRLPEFLRRLPTGGIPAVLELPPFPAPATNAALLGERTLVVRRADLDGVGHANNTRYVEWGLEAVPEEWSKTRALSGLDIVYRREALYGDTLESRALGAERGDAALP